MARTQKDTVNYFPHDTNASSGDTLTILQSRFGNDGYAFWFKLLEKLCGTEGHFIDCSNPLKWQLFIAKMGVDEITTVEILKLLVEMKAIDDDLWKSKLIWCQKLVDNLSDVYKNRRREIPKKPIITSKKAITTIEKGLIPVESTQSKVNKSKVNKSIYGEFNNISLSDEELEKLKTRFGKPLTDELIEKLSGYKKSTGKRYKDDYATILNWARREPNKTPRAVPRSYSSDWDK